MVRESLLSEITRTRGASFEEFHGWSVADRFGSLDAEYRLARQRTALCDLSHRPKLRITGGAEGADFLHRMTTNDIKGLRPGHGLINLLLTVQGKLVADMRVFHTGECLLLDFDPCCFDAALESFSKYRLSTKFDLIAENEIASLGLLGPGSPALLASLAEGPASLQEDMENTALPVAGANVRAILTTYHGAEGYELWAERELLFKIIARLEETASPQAIGWIGWRTIKALRVEAGIPWFGVDMDGTNFPQEVLMEGAVSFTKGCYLGQETVARIKYRGHVNKTLVGLRFESSEVPAAGNKILSQEREVGWITSAVRTPGLDQPIGLGFVRRGFGEPGIRLQTVSSSGSIKTEVVALPFQSHRFDSDTA